MRRIMLFRLGGPDVHLPRLIGAFILFAAVLMFLKAGAQMFESWDAVKGFDDCMRDASLTDSEVVAYAKYSDCKEALYNSTGVQLRGDQDRLKARQVWTALLGPIANLFLWAIVFIFGIMIYRTGTIVIPIEQTIRELPERPAAPAAKAKPKK